MDPWIVILIFFCREWCMDFVIVGIRCNIDRTDISYHSRTSGFDNAVQRSTPIFMEQCLCVPFSYILINMVQSTTSPSNSADASDHRCHSRRNHPCYGHHERRPLMILRLAYNLLSSVFWLPCSTFICQAQVTEFDSNT
jgi:hypothetical protein